MNDTGVWKCAVCDFRGFWYGVHCGPGADVQPPPPQQQQLPAKHAIAILLARQEAVHADLALIEEELYGYSETDPGAWMQATDERFRRISDRLIAKLTSRGLLA